MSFLRAKAIRTSIFHPGMDLNSFLAAHLAGEVRERSVVAVTSKIVSLAENRFVPKDSIEKMALIRRESDRFLCETSHGVTLTIKEGILIPSAGIDESNSESGHYLLYPEDPFGSTKSIYLGLKKEFGLRELGVILTDSHTQPLRRGVTGIALAHWGIRATRSLVGEEDLFGRKLKMTHVNAVDALAVSAVYAMGEAGECQPLAVLEASDLVFQELTDPSEIRIPLEEDLYGPLFKPKD